ncbi:MAG: putative addiction module antidote proteinCopG/Arc/MetJ family [Caulobacter sp.]|nr:putative addiction module antidote proteinCopG/Arc/MetJ family [Caulobacter sp.]
MTRTSRPITVTLGAYQEKVEARVASGEYESVSEVVRAGLRALEREEADLDAWARARIEAYEKDPRPLISWDEAKARLKAHHEARVKADAEKA